MSMALQLSQQDPATMSMALQLSQSLAAAMWTIALMIIFFNVLLIIMGWPRKKENGVNGFFLYYLLLCNLLTAMFVLLHASLDNTIKDDGTDDKYHSLCSLSGYVGVASWMLSLSAMLTMATHLLLHLLFPRCFKQGKNYLPKMRGIAFIEGLMILLLITLPFLPFDVFKAGQSHSRFTLCLPMHSPYTAMWEITLLLYIVESVGVFTIFLLFAMMFCHLSRQQNVLVTAIPMEGRVMRKNSLLVKRHCCMLLGAVIFWIPSLLTLLCMFAGVQVSDVVLQWMFGVVQPFGSVAGPFFYLLRVTCKNYTMSSCIKGTRSKVAKARDAVQMQIGQLTGAITVPQKMDAYTVPNGNHVVAVESIISSTHQKSIKRSNAPSVVHWVEEVPVIGRHMNMKFGIVEWQSKNGSPRRGLLKVFIKPHSREWRNESSILYRLSRLEHHRNIVEYLWHSKSSQTKLDREPTEPTPQDPEKPAIQRFICTAYYQHGTLRDFLHNHPRTIQESHVHAIATQVSAGMAYLHAMRIAHGLMETTSVLIGGHVETMAIKVVIANFSRAVDLTRKPSSNLEGSSKKDDHPSTPSTTLPNVPGSTVYQETPTQSHVPERALFVGDVRSFALILLEMIAWLKMIRVPDDGEPIGQFKSWTLDRKPKCGLSRGWTLAPSDGRAWSDDACHITMNQKISSSLDSCGSDFNSSTDDVLSEGHTMHCWENAVAGCALRDDFQCPPSSSKDFPSLAADNPSWEEIGTFPRRTKRQKPYAIAEFSSDCTLENQPSVNKKFNIPVESSVPSAKKEVKNGPTPQEQARKGLANMTEDGSCCIVNPYFDMMASDDEVTPSAPSTDELQLQSVSVHAVPGGTVTGSDNLHVEKPKNGHEPSVTKQNGKRRRNHLVVAKDNSHCAKRDSLCSVDSGISSHQSSMRSSSSDKKVEGQSSAVKSKSHSLMVKRQRMIHQSGIQGTFESFPENGDGISATSNGDLHAGQNVETWVENHSIQNGQHRPGAMLDRTQRIKPRVPETLQEVDSPEFPAAQDTTVNPPSLTHNGEVNDVGNQCSHTKSEASFKDTVTSSEESGSEKCNNKSRVTVTRSASSLSQFYVRKRAPRPHNITIVPGATTTLPASLQRRSIHAPDSPRLLDMGRGRPSSCHGQVANKSSSLDSASLHSSDSTDQPCCTYHSQYSPVSQAHSGTILPRQTRSLEDSCSSQGSIITHPKTGSAAQSCTEPSQSIMSLRKLHRQDAILESINELTTRSINHRPSSSFEDKLQSSQKKSGRRKTGSNSKRVPSTGIGQQHVNFCQELQALLPCLPKVVLGFWWKQQGCGQAVLQWIDSLKDYDGCLYSQLIGILECCWSKEPALSSAEVHLMLDNCLTEVAL